MAFPYRGGPQSPRDAHQFSAYSSNPLSPPRNSNRLSGGFMSSSTTNNTASEARAGLTRRFTTNALPTLSPIGQQRRIAAGDTMQSSAFARLPPSEQKYRHYEQLLEEQRRIQAYIEQVDPDTRREVEDNLRHEQAVAQMIAQSEPTTPPEYADAFPSALSKPNRYSSASMMSPPGIINRPSRSNTQLTSPPSNFNRPYANNSSNIPSQSVPGSRRQSDDEEDDDDFFYNFDASVHRAAANPNRNSMPVTGYDRKRNQLPDLSSILGPVNTTSFLFDDEDKPVALASKNKTSPSDGKTFLQVQHTADGFPKLIRREENGIATFADPSAALDLALTANAEQHVADRITAARHRISLPPSALRNNEANIAGISSILTESNVKSAANNRRSVEFNLATEPKRPSLMASPPRDFSNGNGIPQSSYSTNDIITLKKLNGTNVTSPLKNSVKPATSSGPTAQNESITSPRVNPSNASNSFANGNTRITQESLNNIQAGSQTAAQDSTNTNGHDNSHTGFQGGASTFIPANFTSESFNPISPMAQYNQPVYGGYGMQTPLQGLNNGFNAMNINGGYGQAQFPMQMYPPTPYGGSMYQQPYHQGNAVGGAARGPNQHNGMSQQQRKIAAEESLARFNSIHVDQLKNEILGLCTDQHGCRFLQRKLDERDEATIQIIFDEVSPQIVKLMTDPFGNYLCQKLLENCNDEQRTVLIRNCMSQMTQIALNQHGTRALQKMIEYVSTPDQTKLIIEAMRFDVVQLIQDLNGNHVIQKCLNHLSSLDAQFIFDAVGKNCIIVGTHRHGCCVLQRCVDHASGLQKGELVRQISSNALNLVQDPFGNYVVQYILDLSEPSFTQPLCHNFLGNVVLLSKQKFSSNVIEKAIRCANEETRRLLIQEIVPPSELEKLLRDSFANYVVQTAFDYADEEHKLAMAENLRPILPSIRHTPYGRRLQSKVQEFDGRTSGFSSGVMTPEEKSVTSPGPNFPQPFPSIHNAPVGRGNRQGFIGNGQQFFGNGNQSFGGANAFNNAVFNSNGNPEIMAPQPKRHSGSLGGMLDPNPNTPPFGLPNGVQNGVQPQTQPPAQAGASANGAHSGPNSANGDQNGQANGRGVANGFDKPDLSSGRYNVHSNPFRYY